MNFEKTIILNNSHRFLSSPVSTYFAYIQYIDIDAKSTFFLFPSYFYY